MEDKGALFIKGRGKAKLDFWGERFKALDFEGGQEISSTRIAIARKGPRLCELYHNGQNVDFDTSGIISEHAIPFLFNDNELKERVKLTDEAIYHGTTFIRIYTVLLTAIATLGGRRIPKREVKAVPAIMTVDGYEHSLMGKVTFDVADLNKLVIEDKEVPEFINGLIEDFLTLHKPFDVEFPIFYLKVKREFLTDSLITDFVYQVAKEDVGSPNVYRNNHYIDGQNLYNYSWLLTKEPYRNRNQVEADFVKVRFFPDKDKERIAVVCYAPHLFPDRCICEDTPLFTDPKIKRIWQDAWKAAPSLKYRTEDGRMEFRPEYKELKDEYRQYLVSNKYPVEDEKNWIYQLEEYEYHRKRSFVILANYLLSFQKAQDLATKIEDAAREKFKCYNEAYPYSFAVDSIDLAYLVGNQLGKDFSERLNEYYRKKEISSSFSIYMDALKSTSLIPDKYRNRYESANQEKIQKCQNISELISVIFSNVHQFVELPGRRDRFENLDRLRFGESFSSFYTRAFVYMPEMELYCKIHQCLDFRIDNGSAVPKYVSQTNHPDQPWLRLFRSGENEDKMLEQQLRLFSIILEELFKISRFNYLPEAKIALAFNYILNRNLEVLVKDGLQVLVEEKSKEDINILPIHYKIDPLKLLRVPVIETEIIGVNNRDVLSFCLDYGVLNRMEGNGNYMLSQTDQILEYRKNTNFFSKNLYLYIQDGVKDVNKIYDQYGEENIEELLNWLYINEDQLVKIQERLKEWVTVLLQRIQEGTVELENVTDFYDIFEAFPVKGADINKDLEVIAEKKWRFQLKDNYDNVMKSPLYQALQQEGERKAPLLQEMLEYFLLNKGKEDSSFWAEQSKKLSLV